MWSKRSFPLRNSPSRSDVSLLLFFLGSSTGLSLLPMHAHTLRILRLHIPSAHRSANVPSIFPVVARIVPISCTIISYIYVYTVFTTTSWCSWVASWPWGSVVPFLNPIAGNFEGRMPLRLDRHLLVEQLRPVGIEGTFHLRGPLMPCQVFPT
jgi:hypothetical protein